MSPKTVRILAVVGLAMAGWYIVASRFIDAPELGMGMAGFDELDDLWPGETRSPAVAPPIAAAYRLGDGDSIALGASIVPADDWIQVPYGAWRFTRWLDEPWYRGPVEVELSSLTADGAQILWIRIADHPNIPALVDWLEERYGTPRYRQDHPLPRGRGIHNRNWSDGTVSLDVRWMTVERFPSQLSITLVYESYYEWLESGRTEQDGPDGR